MKLLLFYRSPFARIQKSHDEGVQRILRRGRLRVLRPPVGQGVLVSVNRLPPTVDVQQSAVRIYYTKCFVWNRYN